MDDFVWWAESQDEFTKVCKELGMYDQISSTIYDGIWFFKGNYSRAKKSDLIGHKEASKSELFFKTKTNFQITMATAIQLGLDRKGDVFLGRKFIMSSRDNVFVHFARGVAYEAWKYERRPRLDFSDFSIEGSPLSVEDKCECGSEITNTVGHSTWCPKY